MKVFLINPKCDALFRSPPIGLQMIATCIEKKLPGIEIECLDPARGDDYWAVDYLPGGKVVVGVTETFMTLEETFHLCDFIKSKNPEAFVVLGGPQATLMPEEAISRGSVDAVVIGEGVQTMPELLECFEKGLDPSGVAGLWFKRADGALVKNAPRAFIMDCDSIPFPDRKFFNDFSYYKGTALKPSEIEWTILSSQSCPFDCNMCQPALRTIAGPWRQRSPENTIAEIKALMDERGARRFSFNDNDMGVNKKWMVDFCRLAKELPPRSFTCCGRANLLDFETLKLMKESGFDYISYGAESGSDRVLTEIMNKRTSVAQVKAFAENCFALGIRANAFWMMANPGETIEEMRQTARLAASLPLYYSHFHIANPNPGTRYYKDAKDGGYLNLNTWGAVLDRSHPTIIKSNVTQEQIRGFEAELIEIMECNCWFEYYNGHTLAFSNSVLFVRDHPVLGLGREAKRFLKRSKARHLKNIAIELCSLASHAASIIKTKALYLYEKTR